MYCTRRDWVSEAMRPYRRHLTHFPKFKMHNFRFDGDDFIRHTNCVWRCSNCYLSPEKIIALANRLSHGNCMCTQRVQVKILFAHRNEFDIHTRLGIEKIFQIFYCQVPAVRPYRIYHAQPASVVWQQKMWKVFWIPGTGTLENWSEEKMEKIWRIAWNEQKFTNGTLRALTVLRCLRLSFAIVHDVDANKRRREEWMPHDVYVGIW